jgi:hypothetical protein
MRERSSRIERGIEPVAARMRPQLLQLGHKFLAEGDKDEWILLGIFSEQGCFDES